MKNIHDDFKRHFGDLYGEVFRESRLNEVIICTHLTDYLNLKRPGNSLEVSEEFNWNYQLPLLIPGCYWARFCLFDNQFQYLVRRSSNGLGARHTSALLQKLDFKPAIIFSMYLQALESAFSEMKVISNRDDSGFEDMTRELIKSKYFPVEAGFLLDGEVGISSIAIVRGDWIYLEKEILASMAFSFNYKITFPHYELIKFLCAFFDRFPNAIIFTFSRVIVVILN
jgi:hypothetical protein